MRNRLLGAALTAAAFVALHPGTAFAHAVPTTWCGGTSVAVTDRKPDSVAGNQISVMYARSLDAPDHFALLATPIASDIAAIDAWWRQQDAARMHPAEQRSRLRQHERHHVFGTCAASFETDATVTLHAAPLAGYRFVGWGGACSGLADCTVTASQDATVSAVFAGLPFRLTAQVSGRGRVVSTPSGIACPGGCAGSFLAGTVVHLTAVPASGYRFSGWSGACKGHASCTVKVEAAASVRATFVNNS